MTEENRARHGKTNSEDVGGGEGRENVSLTRQVSVAVERLIVL